MSFGRSESLYERALASIWKGGSEATQNEALRRCGFPRFLERAEGCHIWDVDGNRYVDYLMGWGSVLLGHGHPQVTDAVRQQIEQAAILNLGSESEIALAERLVRYLPGADHVRFVTTGSEAASAAVRVARAATGRNKIVRFGYHGWHDWCQTDHLAGIPRYVTDDTLTFAYNDLDSLRALPALQRGEVAGIIIEPVKHTPPAPGFLQNLRSLAQEQGSLLVFDEVKTGFRLGLGGAQTAFDVTPDLSTFGKALGNGYPIALLAGKESVFSRAAGAWITGTFHGWPPAIAAAHATLTFLEQQPSQPSHIQRLGRRLMEGFNGAAEERGLAMRLSGVAAMPHLSLPNDERAIVEKLIGMMVGDGYFIHPTQPWYISYSHDEGTIDKTLSALQMHLDNATRIGA